MVNTSEKLDVNEIHVLICFSKNRPFMGRGAGSWRGGHSALLAAYSSLLKKGYLVYVYPNDVISEKGKQYLISMK